VLCWQQKAKGADKIFVSDLIDERLSIAVKEGVAMTLNPGKENIVGKIMHDEPLGLDMAFECCGKQEALDEAVELLKPGGKLIVIGFLNSTNGRLMLKKTRRKEISLQFIRRQVDCVDETLEMMKKGLVTIDNMVTHRFLSKNKRGFRPCCSLWRRSYESVIDF